MIPAILFEPDGYVVSGDRVMGRQSAGDAFLRAALQACEEGASLFAYTPRHSSAEVFGKIVHQARPGIDARWCRADDFPQLSALGGLYLAGPDLAEHAHMRARIGHAAYSLTGITHTIASHRAMDAITSMLAAPVMPWDALICTSAVAQESIRIMLSEQAAMLQWRFGKPLDFTLPLTPIIPLGVHAGDFRHSPDERLRARATLGIEDETTVLLYSGRLSFHAKAHPHAMYLAAQRVQEETGRKIILIHNGWFANANIEAAFREGAARHAPQVTALFANGRAKHEWRRAWAAADVFLSLSDNIQETFGLTPIEAMAAGLPVLATDWNGYKDTVRDGVDGFRIPTCAPAAGYGVPFAVRHSTGIDNYDFYCGLTCQTVSVDHDALAEKLKLLVLDPSLRVRMGQAGRKRVADTFDWKVVFTQYEALWDQQARMRAEAIASPDWSARLAAAPALRPSRLDPFVAFGHYPSSSISGDTVLRAQAGATAELYRSLASDPLFSYASPVLPNVEHAGRIMHALAAEPHSVAQLAARLGVSVHEMVRHCAVMMKMNLLTAR